MIKIIWIIYAVAMLAFVLLALIGSLISREGILYSGISTVFTLVYLSGLYGFVFNKAILNANFWKVMFGLNVFGLSVTLVLLFFTPQENLLFQIILVFGFSLPLLYALFKYSRPANEIWQNTSIGKKVLLLDNLLEEESSIEATVISILKDAELKTSVCIQKDQETFTVKINKHGSGSPQVFSNIFEELESVVKFIETNTPVTVNNFEQKA